MPCYTVQTMSVEFKVAHKELLEKAIMSLGWRQNTRNGVVTVYSTSGIFTVNLNKGIAVYSADQQDLVNQLKRAYSGEALKLVAKKNNWQLAKKSTTKGTFVKSYF